jgi:hypothetical protein
MTSIFDKLNLKPGERRFVVFVALIAFIVVNALMVWPKFFDWNRVTMREKRAKDELQQYRREVDNIKKYQLTLRDLAEKGAQVSTEQQASELQNTVRAQAQLSGVTINNYIPVNRAATGSKTNMFFEEQSATVQFSAEEKPLVDFLYNLGAGSSMIRVRHMTLNPELPNRYRLQGSITLVASYQRSAPVRTANTNAPGVRATTTATGPRTSMTNISRAGTTNAPAAKPGWWQRLWPFGKKSATSSTNAPAKTNAPGRTNSPATK